MECRHAARCGGCDLIGVPYRDQLTRKAARLRERLNIRTGSSSTFLPVWPDTTEPVRFRQKVAFTFAAGPSGHGLLMGHYERGTQRVVPIQECLVHSDRGNRIAFALRAHLARAGVTAAGPSLSGIVRHILIRTTEDDREAVAMLVVTRNDRSLRAPVRALLDSADAPDGFYINVNTDPGPYLVGEQSIRIAGRSHVREELGGISYLISPGAFFQTSIAAARVLQQHVVRSAAGAARVLDLYCGSGLFSLPIAAAGARVTGVEENRQAIADAKTNARINGIPGSRARFLASRVEDAVRALARDPWDAVVLDPPRQGCSDAVLEAVFQEMRPPLAIYVSCNPESLAAELPGIVQCGYRVEDLRAVDMFPHTDHIEAVVRLRRQDL